MYSWQYGIIFRYISPIGLINQKKIDQINSYLQNHTLEEFKEKILDFKNNHWFLCCSDMFYLTALANYKTYVSKLKINYSTQHFKQMLKILQQKYFDRLHILIDMIDVDFPLYSEYVELMFKYMLDSDVKLTDCIAQISTLDKRIWQPDYHKFLPLAEKMLLYCKNEQLKQQVKEKVINRIKRIIDGKQEKLFVSLEPIVFYNPNELDNIQI